MHLYFDKVSFKDVRGKLEVLLNSHKATYLVVNIVF